MATAGIQNGTLTLFKDGGVKLDHLTEISWEASVAMIDISTKDSAGNKEILPGQRSYSFSGTAYFAENATEGASEIIANITGRTAATLRWSTGVSGDEYIEASGYASNLSYSAGTEDARSFSYTYECTGAVTVAAE